MSNEPGFPGFASQINVIVIQWSWYLDAANIMHLLLNGAGGLTHSGDGVYFYNPSQLKISEGRSVTMDYRGNIIICESDYGYIRRIRFDTLSSDDAGPLARAKLNSVDWQANGKMRLKFAAKPAGVHLIQASSNLKDWETMGVAHDNGDGTFDFEDPATTRLPSCFYRILSP